MPRARQGCKLCRLGAFYNPKILAGGGILLMAEGPGSAPNAPGGHAWKQAPKGYLLPSKKESEAVIYNLHACASCWNWLTT
ncbi:MAG: hypothetical protein ACFFDI_17210 [Promethearchaeota archaeon]